ncbi:MAG: hypothetical protein ABEL76_08070, partial [Bradymonadaceae bacterium]
KQLAEEIGVELAEGVHRLKAGHPLGYQITEALAYCYFGQKKFAKAWSEAMALEDANRNVSLAENIYFARRSALHEVEQKLNTEEKIVEALPNYKWRHQYSIPLPGSTKRSPNFDGMIRNRANIDTVGGPKPEESDRENVQKTEFAPPVVASMEEVDGGVKIVFEKNTETYRVQPMDCEPTDRIAYWQMEGNRMVPHYEQDCEPVGEEETRKTTHQHDPVVLPSDEAKRVDAGARLEVVDNADAAGDAALKRVWPEGADRDDPSIVAGWSL